MASKKAIQDRILPEAPATVRSAPKPKAAAPVKARGAGAFYSPGDYSRRKGDLLGLRDVQKEFGPRVKSTPAPANYVKSRNLARLRALRDKPLSEQFTPAYYVTNPTDVPKQSMTVAQRMDLRNKILSGAYKRRSDIPAMPAATGEESITVKKTAATTRKPIAPARKPPEITIPGGGLRTGAKAKAKAPTRMAVNPRTGSTLGFTTGSRTGSTATKAGVAGKTKMSGSQRMAQNAFNKGGVAGPRKDSSGRNVSSASGKRK